MTMRGRNLRRSVYVLLVFSLTFTSLKDIGARSQPSLKSTQAVQASQEVPVKKDSAENPLSGAQLYKRLCAACHGNDLKGNGPAPAPFKGVPPDLTTLTQRHGGNSQTSISRTCCGMALRYLIMDRLKCQHGVRILGRDTGWMMLKLPCGLQILKTISSPVRQSRTIRYGKPQESRDEDGL
jgi:hypothetical protein